MSLSIQNINKSYTQAGQKIEVLKGVSIDVKSGELIAIIGQSGSGKSTLLSLLAGLDLPDSGKIIINNQDITQKEQDQMTLFRAKNIGIVFQQFHLMAHLTALENVMLPLEILDQENIESKAKSYLELMELGHRFKHFPGQMSGGECQRVAMARALVVEPSVLLADEPSGNLDVETGKRVMSVFLQAVRKQKITTILVTHNEALAEQCDRKLVLKNGVL